MMELPTRGINEQRRAIACSCVKPSQSALEDTAKAPQFDRRSLVLTRSPNHRPLDWGTGGREFKSPRSDHKNQRLSLCDQRIIRTVSTQRIG
jgi:hypothetical protein